MASYVIDSWPVLEWLQNKEPAAQAFDDFLEQSLQHSSLLYPSRINYGEIVYSPAKNLPQDVVENLLSKFRTATIEIVSVDDDLVDEAAAIKSRNSVSYADCFATALALRLQIPVVTGDAEFLKLQARSALQVTWLGA